MLLSNLAQSKVVREFKNKLIYFSSLIFAYCLDGVQYNETLVSSNQLVLDTNLNTNPVHSITSVFINCAYEGIYIYIW